MMQIHFFSLKFSSQSELCGLRFSWSVGRNTEFVALESKLNRDLNLLSDSDLFKEPKNTE
jgi:hypothetical protein